MICNITYSIPIFHCSIIKSPAVWAITATHVTQNFGYYVLLTELPTYMKNVLNWDLKNKVCRVFSTYIYSQHL